jgi:regulator of sirC expression with transglutaminase-like and TPR domain
VSVRLDDEAGAAGLAFCADGGEKHYGFYPTGGKLRLTRFEGADVFSWKVLNEAASEAYRPGEWNTLRVRVEKDRIKCFVNERQVFDQADGGLRGGEAGLCKFRTTQASYKGFRIGADLVEKPIDVSQTEGLRKSMEGFLAGKDSRENAVDSLLADPALSRRVLADRRKAMEQSAAALRDLEREVHRAAVARDLAQQLALPDAQADLLRCALLISRHDNPELDIESYLREFARMVEELKSDAEIAKGTLPAVKRLTSYLFEQNGFHGSRHDYENRSNSYINEVLDDREGLPITLSVIYVELASRLGVKNVAGIPLPARFMVGYREDAEGEFSLLDVFEGGKELTMKEAKELVGGGAEVPEETTRPATKKEIVLRMIRNLLGRALESPNAANEAGPYFNLVLAIEPGSFRERVTRARLREFSGNKKGAAEDLAWLVEHPPKELDEEQLMALEGWLAKLRGEE